MHTLLIIAETIAVLMMIAIVFGVLLTPPEEIR